MRKTVEEAQEAFHEFAERGAIGRIFGNRLVSGEWFMWTEQIIKLHEMDKAAADAVRRVAKIFGGTRIEITIKDGVPDRVNVSRGIE